MTSLLAGVINDRGDTGFPHNIIPHGFSGILPLSPGGRGGGVLHHVFGSRDQQIGPNLIQ